MQVRLRTISQNKNISMLIDIFVVIRQISKAWNKIKPIIITRSWRKLMNIGPPINIGKKFKIKKKIIKIIKMW